MAEVDTFSSVDIPIDGENITICVLAITETFRVISLYEILLRVRLCSASFDPADTVKITQNTEVTTDSLGYGGLT